MKIKYLKLRNWLIVTMSGLLGINLGCDEIPMNEYGCEYGCPEATYDVKGTVTNEDGQPIEGIGVRQTRDWSDENSETYGEIRYVDTTDANGQYDVRFSAFPQQMLKLDFNDIDGDENGSYLDTVVSINTEQVPLTGGDGHWYVGRGTVIQNVTMKNR